MTIVQALRRTRELLARSEDSIWSAWSASEVRDELGAMQDALEHDRAIDARSLQLLFMVTGPVQEISMASGWADEMLVLAEIVDAYSETAALGATK